MNTSFAAAAAARVRMHSHTYPNVVTRPYLFDAACGALPLVRKANLPTALRTATRSKSQTSFMICGVRAVHVTLHALCKNIDRYNGKCRSSHCRPMGDRWKPEQKPKYVRVTHTHTQSRHTKHTKHTHKAHKAHT